MITKNKLKPKDIAFLNNDDVLYSLDFRALSENMDYRIPAMWKYENILPWILSDRIVVVNNDFTVLKYPNVNSFIIAKKRKDPRISVYNRISEKAINNNIKKLWVAVPHPDTEMFCAKNKLKINYSYDLYIRYNDKIRQKKLLGNMTPNWRIVSSRNEVEILRKKYGDGYIKRRNGSGGYAVFKLNKLDSNFYRLFEKSPNDWYFEEGVGGKFYSVQCVKNKKDIIIFGFSEQIIKEDKFYSGSKILSLDLLNKDLFSQIKKALNKFDKFLVSYTGFFGLDFVLDKNGKIFVLEANIRMTAVTIPTLLSNVAGAASALFREDVNKKDIKKDDVLLTCEIDGLRDVLSF